MIICYQCEFTIRRINNKTGVVSETKMTSVYTNTKPIVCNYRIIAYWRIKN